MVSNVITDQDDLVLYTEKRLMKKKYWKDNSIWYDLWINLVKDKLSSI